MHNGEELEVRVRTNAPFFRRFQAPCLCIVPCTRWPDIMACMFWRRIIEDPQKACVRISGTTTPCA